MIRKTIRRLTRRNLSDLVNLVLFVLIFLVLAHGIEIDPPSPSTD